MSRWWIAAGLGTLSVAVCAWDLLKEVTITFITLILAWSQVKQQGGITAWPIKRNFRPVSLTTDKDKTLMEAS